MEIIVSLLRRLDAFDINGKDLATCGVSMEQQVQQLATEVGIPVIVGSDTHHPLQFGCVRNKLDREYSHYADIRRCIQEGRYHYEISDSLPLHVKSASLVKKLLKDR